MKPPQLAIFWRDRQACCFTSWHFCPAKGESPTHRAQLILALCQHLSCLQIYGAALDADPLPIEQAHTAPPTGTDLRLQVNLCPDKPVNPKAGINYIKFSIPGPIAVLIDIVESLRFDHPVWLLLENVVWPFLCLPDATMVTTTGSPLYRAEIAYLDLKHRPQPNLPPIEQAISRTSEDLNIAQASLNKIDTPRERNRVQKYQARLEDLFTWQYIERGCFDLADNLPVLIPEELSIVLPDVSGEFPSESASALPSQHSSIPLAQVPPALPLSAPSAGAPSIPATRRKTPAPTASAPPAPSPSSEPSEPAEPATPAESTPSEPAPPSKDAAPLRPPFNPAPPARPSGDIAAISDQPAPLPDNAAASIAHGAQVQDQAPAPSKPASPSNDAPPARSNAADTQILSTNLSAQPTQPPSLVDVVNLAAQILATNFSPPAHQSALKTPQNASAGLSVSNADISITDPNGKDSSMPTKVQDS
jgi:hypothetical protein